MFIYINMQYSKHNYMGHSRGDGGARSGVCAGHRGGVGGSMGRPGPANRRTPQIRRGSAKPGGNPGGAVGGAAPVGARGILALEGASSMHLNSNVSLNALSLI